MLVNYREVTHMLDLALHFARQGYPVFPLTPGGKMPLIPQEKGGKGFKDATTSVTLIDQWWTEEPRANIGIATGKRSDLLVIDVDPKRDQNWIKHLSGLRLPETYTVKTWSGGWHLYFRYPHGSNITVGKNLVPAIDWRGEGGYVVAPGSMVGGALYTVAKAVPIAILPAKVVKMLQESKKKPRVIEIGEGGAMKIPDGSRNDHLMRIGCAIRRWGVGFEALWACLDAINNEHCSPPVPEDEVKTIAASCARYAPDASGSAVQ